MTPEEASRLANDEIGARHDASIKEFLVTATASQILVFIQGLQIQTKHRLFDFATSALSVHIADEQAKAAAKLENYTRTLIRLTWALIWLTVGILVFTIFLAVKEHGSKPENENNHPSQNQQAPNRGE